MSSHSGPPFEHEHNTFILPSGRTIGYARYGAASSRYPCTIYLHGYPSTRIEAAIYHNNLISSDLQMIAIDRPGFGLSSPYDKPLEERTILDYTDDIRALADHLDLKQFQIIGVSGGAPYAFACAHVFPERITHLGVLAGMGPFEYAMSKTVWSKLWWVNKLGFVASVRFTGIYTTLYNWLAPWLVRRFTKSTYNGVKNSSVAKKASKSKDMQVLLAAGEEGYEAMKRNTLEMIRQEGFARHTVEDARLLTKKWPFELEDLDSSKIRLWYGSADVNTPEALGEMIRSHLGDEAVLEVIPDGTHASVIFDGVKYLKEMLGVHNDAGAFLTADSRIDRV